MKIFKNKFFSSYSNVLISIGLGVLNSFIIIRFYGIENLGIYTTFNVFLNYAVFYVNINNPKAILLKLLEAKSDFSKKFISYLFFSNLLIFLLTLIFFYSFRSSLYQYLDYKLTLWNFIFLFVGSSLQLFYWTYNPLCQYLEKIYIINYAELIKSISYSSFLIYFSKELNDLNHLILAFFVSNLLSFGWYFITTYKFIDYLNLDFLTIDFFKKIKLFYLNSIKLQSINILNNSRAFFIINILKTFSNFEFIGVYKAAQKMSVPISLVASPLKLIYIKELILNFKNELYGQSNKILINTTILILLWTLGLSIFYVIFFDQIIELLNLKSLSLIVLLLVMCDVLLSSISWWTKTLNTIYRMFEIKIAILELFLINLSGYFLLKYFNMNSFLILILFISTFRLIYWLRLIYVKQKN